MYEREKVIVVREKRTLMIGKVVFEIPFRTTCYFGTLYYCNVTPEMSEKEAIAGFEKAIKKEKILPGTDLEYDYRKDENELAVTGHFLFLADSKEEFDAVCERCQITIGNMQETDVGALSRTTDETAG